ncbi:hypothetical protein GCM10011348_04600 [Marinobacterium nitratireducens]|uniref:Potassium channel domain-containing protein n=1 Tax=Marinobacterium nitratireducens TaxID=518897 RepID=A0A917Z7B4_9GAMM|nr:ion channel [Marinobacterium nitratireducens]GGO76721.1 hypothetical protein GCM10011348_04600 [Marinobacterium nitratireducens]
MLINLMMGLPTMVFCLLMQSLLVMVVVRYYGRHRHQIENDSFTSSLIVINVVMLLLVLGNLVQVAIWALLFLSLGEFEAFAEAFYHSAVNFATLGYGDFVMSERHKLLGPLQAINGVLMIGVSTAALMSAFQDAMKKTLEARKGGSV